MSDTLSHVSLSGVAFGLVLGISPTISTIAIVLIAAVFLEYLADRSVLDNGVDNKEYQYHLLGLTYRKNVATISNNFNVLPIKKIN